MQGLWAHSGEAQSLANMLALRHPNNTPQVALRASSYLVGGQGEIFQRPKVSERRWQKKRFRRQMSMSQLHPKSVLTVHISLLKVMQKSQWCTRLNSLLLLHGYGRKNRSVIDLKLGFVSPTDAPVIIHGELWHFQVKIFSLGLDWITLGLWVSCYTT